MYILSHEEYKENTNAISLIETEFKGTREARKETRDHLKMTGYSTHTASMVDFKSGHTVAALSYLRSDLDKKIVIEYLTTHVLHERKGLGKQLVECIKDLSQKLTYKLFVVSLLETVPFWQKNGFFHPSTCCDEIDLYEDCVVFQALRSF